MALSVPPSLLSVSRLISARLTAALMTALSVGPLPVLAQTGAAAKPASMEVMSNLTLAAAVSTCELALSSKIPVETSMVANAKAITYLVKSRYGGQIEQADKLNDAIIFNVTAANIVAILKKNCYTKLTDSDKKFIDNSLASINNAAKPAPQKK